MLSEQRWKLHALPTGIGGQVANALCRESGSIVLDGVTSVQGVRESRTQGEAAIRFLEMAEMPGMRGRDC